MSNRVVFDTNIWVRKMMYGTVHNFAEWIFTKNITPLYSLSSVAEIVKVLNSEKFAKYDVDIEENIEIYKSICEFCRTKKTFTDCADKKDNYLFDLAIQGKAHYIVTDDKIVLATPTPGRKLKKMTFPQFKEDIQ